MKVSSNGRYLVDQNDVPFLMVGDSPQSVIGNLSESEADRYFADRQAHGFNTVWINLLCDSYTFCNSDGTTYDGIKPFTTGSDPSSYDLSTPNPAYFQRVDDIINLAASHGLLVVLDPIETGGWLGTLQANGPTKDFTYGAYLGSRYKSFPNIVWMSGNDFQSWSTPSDDAVVRSVAQGIQSTDPNHLQTSELNYLASSSLDDSSWSSTLGLNAAYTYYPTYAEVLHAYDQSPTMPAFMVEANYEFEHNGGTDGGSTQNLRRQEYWTMLSGATGQLYGSYYTDRIANGWSAANLDSVGVTQLGYMTALFKDRPWYDLVPDQSHTLVTAGYGTFSSSGSIDTNDYATAARTLDGSLAIVYMPTARTVTVDMTQLGSNVTAQWYDPTNGSYTTINGSPFANTGSRQFTPPATNSGGDTDWVLVLTTTGGGPPPPPPPLTIGETNVLPTPDDGNGNLLVAQSASLSQTATLTSLSFYATTPAGKLRLGIYDSSGPGGGPGTLEAQTAEITPATGWNTANVTTPIPLPAGTYWLAYFPSDNNLAFLKTADATSSGKYYNLPYGTLPTTFSTAPNATPSHWSFYATLNGGLPAPPPPPPPTFTIGETNVLPTPDDGNGNLLVAQSAVLSQTATLASLSFDVTNAAGKLRLGVYDSSGPGGGPGVLEAQTPEITPATGWNTATVTNPVSLPPGTYWLAYFASDNNLAFLKTADASSSGKYYSLPYGTLPATFSTAPNNTPSHWSFYATLTANAGTTQPAH